MSTLSIDVQRAAIEDAAEIAAVHDTAWRYAYRGILDGVELERMIERRGPRWWAKAIARNIAMLVIKVEGRVVGYATMGPSRMRALPFRGEIYELYLHPDMHGVGLGRRLFEEARAALADMRLDGLVVRVLAANTIGVGFYEQLGGHEVIGSSEKIAGRLVPVAVYAWPPVGRG
ncbi:N-acetyltransferase family protein [Pleomorphomonas sp. PLEO]|uniref:GNAT family N-acetyltransferase n=1 Tax=Pleomorphomonas sp. PLEO TaxID=3239306 RepID=UPI00351ECA55